MYFEDFYIGQRFLTDPVIITEEEIYEFAKKYDPQPIHIDPDYAEHSYFGGIIASGLHTLSIIWGQWVCLNKFGTEAIGGIGIDSLNWTAPVRPNDELKGDIEVVEMIPTSKGGRGIMTLRITVINQSKQVVLTTQVKGMHKIRPLNMDT
ncbi:bifunctional aldehyde dehydrogenase/enoyl-CoA hydratase [Peptococcaceae bacterium CEB3]|nr:bifunctional aldehyde dehydrogenase/enoyl-CoA hydratase [Peptococcaceae bacterium CEB3]